MSTTPTGIPGIHHVTSIASDPQENLAFYTETLGLRFVKKSVNQDDPSTYHLFYGDNAGNKGTSMTFFPWPDAHRGTTGTGQVVTTAFLVPADALEYWSDRLEAADIEVTGPTERFDDHVLSFEDPDGLGVELVGVPDAPEGDPWLEAPVPAEHAIRGFHSVTLSIAEADLEATVELLELMGFRPAAEAGDRRRYTSNADIGYAVDIETVPDETATRGRLGAGITHHVAFRVADEAELEAWRGRLEDHGLSPTHVIDRKYFRSIYFRTPGGVLFEFATDGPGYTVDEPLEELGTTLSLPERLEGQREAIERSLPPLELDVPVAAGGE